MHEFFVTGDGFPGDGMNHWISVMFKVGDQLFYSVLHEDARVHMVFINTFS